MFDALIALSLRHRPLVLVVAGLLFVVGLRVIAQAPVDVFPDLNRPTVTVLIESGGLAPAEVEVRVARPVELALMGAPGVARVRSQSGPGLAVLWAEFGWDVAVPQARQAVAERLATAVGALPEGVHVEMGPQSSIMGEILLVGLYSPGGEVSGPAVRSLAETLLRPRLQGIQGVSQVITMGGGVEQLEVAVDPAAAARLGLSLSAIAEAVRDAQGAAAGGFVEARGEEWMIRHQALLPRPEALADAPLPGLAGVRLGEVATVRIATAPARGLAGVNGHPAVVLSVQKQPGQDTRVLTRAIEGALDDLDRSLPPGVERTLLFRQADFIDAAVENVVHALRDGVVLVAFVLVVFLLNARTTAITLCAIPLSFVIATFVLRAMGESINTMTLGGLAIAIGELVDDAIVDVENVLRRLRENQRAERPRPAIAVVLAASLEVRNSIVFSTMLVVLVFVPLFAMGGIEGRLFVPLGLAYVFSILASLLVSITVTPALAAWLLPSEVARSPRGDGALVRALKQVQLQALRWALPRPTLVVGGALLAAVAAAGVVPFLGTSFLPPFSEGTATVNMQLRPGTSLRESDRLGRLAEEILLSVPEVVSTGRRTGRAEADEHAEGVAYTEIDVDFRDGDRPRAEVLAEVRARLSGIPGADINLGQPISHRLDHLLSGVRAALSIKIFGDDLGVVRATAGAVAARLGGIDGVVDVSVEPQVLVTELQTRIDPDAALRFGIPAGWLSRELSIATAGQEVGTRFDGVRPVDLVVRWDRPWVEDPDLRSAAPMVGPDGQAVPLSELVRWVETSSPNQILHEGGRRRIAVLANVAGRDLGSTAEAVRSALGELPMPPGVSWHLGGQFESRSQAQREMAGLAFVGLLLTVLVLWMHLRSLTLVAQVLINIPLALIGSVVAVLLSGQPLSVATLVGFVTLCGIASRNTILLISHYIHLRCVEGEPWGEALVVRGTQERLVPVAMTALCAGLGLLPLAVSGGTAGREILSPVAQVILGGLVSSTLLDLIVTPALVLRFGQAAVERHLHRRDDP